MKKPTDTLVNKNTSPDNPYTLIKPSLNVRKADTLICMQKIDPEVEIEELLEHTRQDLKEENIQNAIEDENIIIITTTNHGARIDSMLRITLLYLIKAEDEITAQNYDSAWDSLNRLSYILGYLSGVNDISIAKKQARAIKGRTARTSYDHELELLIYKLARPAPTTSKTKDERAREIAAEIYNTTNNKKKKYARLIGKKTEEDLIAMALEKIIKNEL